MKQLDNRIKALEKGLMLSGIVNIPADKSSYNKDIVIQLFAFKVADKGYQLTIEKYYSGQWDGELSKKNRRFIEISELELYVANNYSIKINDFKICSEIIKMNLKTIENEREKLTRENNCC